MPLRSSTPTPTPKSAAGQTPAVWRGAGRFGLRPAALAPVAPSQFIDLLNGHGFKAAVPPVIVNKLHSLRVHGNRAAHGEKCRPQTAVWLLEEAFDLGRWLVKTFTGQDARADADSAACSACRPTDGRSTPARKSWRSRSGSRPSKQPSARLLEELEAARAKAQAAEANATELQAALQAGQQAADALSLDEETTRRRMIDELCSMRAGTSAHTARATHQVGQEVAVPGQPTPSGEGQGRLRPVRRTARRSASSRPRRPRPIPAGADPRAVYAEGWRQ